MADERDAQQAAAAKADLALSDKEAEDVKGGVAYGKKGRKKKKSASSGGGSANVKPM